MSPDVAASVKAHLLKKAKEHREEFQRTLVRFTIERFLYRLSQSKAADRCVLKGAAMLSVWMSDPYRATRDIDLLASGADDEQAIRAIIEDACAVDCPSDGVRFDLSTLTIESVRDEEEYSGKRALFDAYLGKAMIRVQIDFGFGDAVTGQLDVVDYPTILQGLPAPRLRGYNRETSIAEKFEAAVKLGTTNSRMKDFHDIWALSGAFAIEGSALRTAVAACFERRGTKWSTETPPALTATFYQNPLLQAKWASYVRKVSGGAPPPGQFSEIGERIVRFLGPVREHIIGELPFQSDWIPGGPWQPRTPS